MTLIQGIVIIVALAALAYVIGQYQQYAKLGG